MIKEKRSLKVYEGSGYKYKVTPAIIFKGDWLKAWGFECGDTIVVECTDGKLVIKNSLEDKVE